ncbi:MAG: hypothetical protein AAGD05_00885 [Bacteroidota bacterium]
MQQIIEANRTFTYVTIPSVRPIGNTRTIRLREEEGANGSLIEPFIDLNFPGLRGRPGNPPVLQTSHFMLKYGFHTRVARASSSPILPPTNRFGFELVKTLWDNTSNTAAFSFRQPDNRNWFRQNDRDLHLLYLILEAQHYSNGQASGVYKDTIQPVNDYENGDFSTNFFSPKLIYSHLDRSDCSLLSLGAGYRVDFGATDGFLKFLPEQERSYGRHRLWALFQWRSAPFELFKWLNNLPMPFRWLTLGRFKQYSVDNQSEYVVKSLYILSLRWEAEYILGNLDRFRLSNRHRFGHHLYLELSPMRSRSIALLFHVYSGRDYLNIRYDDIVFSWQVGISAALSKYKPIGFRSSDAIVEKL